MIALLCALDEEIKDFLRAISIKRVSSYQCCRIYEGRLGDIEIVLALTGMGGEHPQQVAQLILATYPVKLLISTGFCGSLNSKTETGDIVVYSSLMTAGGMSAAPDRMEMKPDLRLIETASRISGRPGCRTLCGRGVTVSQVCDSPEDKIRLGREYNADAVDMESCWIGQIALEKKIRFLAARAVFDNAKDNLSVLNEITSRGKVVSSKVFSHLLVHPSRINHFRRYANNSRKASTSLAVFLSGLIAQIQIE